MKNALSGVRTIIVVLCSAWIVLFWWSQRAVHWAVYDDSFYYFTIARNLAQGWGSTFDRLHPTNGYHPLWLLVCTAIYKVQLGDEAAIRALLSLQIIGLGVALAVGVRVLASSALDIESTRARAAAVFLGGLVLACFALSPFGITLYANGLEGTCTLLAMVVLTERLHTFGGKLDGQRWLLAVLGTFAFLARTDAIFLVPWLAIYAYACGGRRREIVQIVGVPCVVIAGYLVFNRVEFGTFTQVSGDLKRIVPTLPRALLGVAIALAPLPIWAAVRRVRFAMLRRTVAFVDRTIPVLGWVCAVTAYYETLQRWQQAWYFVAPTFYLALVVAHVVIDLIALSQSVPRIAGILVVGGAVLFFTSSVRDALIPGATAMIDADREAGIWIGDHLEPTAVLGSWDAGALGYYSHRRVVNLDGEVGSVGLKRAIRSGTTAQWLNADRVRIDYVVNHTFDEDGGSERLKELARDCFGEERVRTWAILNTWDYFFRGGANGKEPRIYGMAVWLARLD